MTSRAAPRKRLDDSRPWKPTSLMTLRIAVGGFLHETHSFAPRTTTWADFVQPGGFPALQQGPGLIEAASQHLRPRRGRYRRRGGKRRRARAPCLGLGQPRRPDSG
jgi:hypothetical protein